MRQFAGGQVKARCMRTYHNVSCRACLIFSSSAFDLYEFVSFWRHYEYGTKCSLGPALGLTGPWLGMIDVVFGYEPMEDCVNLT
eukprot:scaffold102273_cov29-Prasinocladus_malaysianus.AAC.1